LASPMISPSLPSVSIQQQNARIGIDADLGKQSIRQPKASFELRTERPQLSISQPPGELKIDQSKAWDALGLGGSLTVMSRIYGQASDIALQGIRRIVEKGNQLTAIHQDTNPIADMAAQIRFRFHEYDFVGPASVDNVDISYTAKAPIIESKNGRVNLQTHPNPVEHTYTRGKLDIYMTQYASIKFDVRI
jgi:hypothetical protein